MARIIKQEPNHSAPETHSAEALDAAAETMGSDEAPPRDGAAGGDRLNRESLERLLQRLESQWSAAQQEWLQRWEQQGVQLACRIAAICLRQPQPPDGSAEVARRLMEEGLRSVATDLRRRVRLSPGDYQSLGAAGPASSQPAASSTRAATATDSAAGRSAFEGVELVADPELAAGECVVEAGDGRIDFRFAAQLERMARELTGSLAETKH